MYKKLLVSCLLVVGLALVSTTAKADSFTSGGVVYTLNPAGAGKVDLTVDTTNATTSTPVLDSFSIQFTGASDVAIDPSTSSDNIGTWTLFGNSPNNPDTVGSTTACNGSTTNANMWCFDTSSALAVGGAGDVYTFEFDVTGTDVGPGTPSHIQFFQGTSLAVSQDIAVPEPSSISMLGIGILALMGLLFVRRKITV